MTTTLPLFREFPLIENLVYLRKRERPEHRFFNQILFSDGCCEWTGLKDKDGYGRFYAKWKISSHRFSWELFYGPIPDGLLVLHTCDNTSCIKPTHLFLGTHKDNMADCVSKGRKPEGNRHGMCKLSDEEVREIRRSSENGVVLGARYGVCRSTISYIRLRKTHKKL